MFGFDTLVGSIRGLKWCFPDVETSPRKQITGEIALRHGVANERLGVACDRRLGAGGGCDCPSARVGGSGLVARLWLQPCQITTHGERRGSGDDAPLCVDPRSSRTAILVRAPEEFVGNRVSCSHTPAKARHHHPPAERRSAFADKRRSQLALGKNVVTSFQDDIYRSAASAGSLVWLWLAVVIVAPIGEETLFRGFVFRGWQRSPDNAWAAIGGTAFLWR